MKCLQHRFDLRHMFEVDKRLLHIHVEDIKDRLATISDLQRLPVEPSAFTDGAGNPHVGEEIHFQAG